MLVVPRTMRAAVYRGPNDMRVETVPVPGVGPEELLVKVAACGVCPTDLKKIQYGTVPPPRIFGHETAGTVVQVGRRVAGFKVGERVALHHHVPCLRCHHCRHRAFAQCDQYKRTGITAGFEPAGGGFAEYVRVMSFVLPGVVKIPARNSFEEGAMLEPVNTVLKGINRLNLLRGDTVLVVGQGPIGLMFTRLLRLRGMSVVATDLLEARLKLARKFGAQSTASPGEAGGRKPGPRGQRAALAKRERLSRLEQGSLRHRRVPDAAILTVPSDAALYESVQAIRGAGQVLLFAHTRRGSLTELDLAFVCVDEKDLLGSYSADVTLQSEVAALIFSRRMDVRPLITHRFPLEQTSSAIRMASHPSSGALKIMVCPDGL